MEEWRERSMVAKRMVVEIMKVLMERIELIIFHTYIIIPMLAWLKYQLLWWISEELEYEPMWTGNVETTESDYWRWRDTRPQYKGVSGAGGDWRGRSQSRWWLFSTEHRSQYIYDLHEYECHYEAVRLLKTHSICKSTADGVPGNKLPVPGMPSTKFLVHQVWAIRFGLRRWEWVWDMSGAHIPDGIGIRKTVISVAAMMISRKLLMEKIVGGWHNQCCWGISVCNGWI